METEAFNDADKPNTEDEDKVKLLSSKKSNARLQRFSIHELQQGLYLSKIKELSLNTEFLVLNEEKYVYQSSNNICGTCEKALERKEETCDSCERAAQKKESFNPCDRELQKKDETCNTCERALQRKNETCDTCIKARPASKIPIPVCECAPCYCSPCTQSPGGTSTTAPKSLCSANEYLREHPPESELPPKPPFKGKQATLEDLSRGPQDICATGKLFQRERVCSTIPEVRQKPIEPTDKGPGGKDKEQGGKDKEQGGKDKEQGGKGKDQGGKGKGQAGKEKVPAKGKDQGGKGKGQGGKAPAKGNVNKNQGGKEKDKPKKNGYDNLPCWEKERLEELKQRERERIAAGLPIKYVPTRKPTARIN